MNSAFDEQTLIDLEFPTVKGWLEKYAVGPTAQRRIRELSPSNNFQTVEQELLKLNELVSIKRAGEVFPMIEFEEIDQELKLLPIKNAVLSQEGFYRISKASDLCNQLIHFFDKREEEYPLLYQLFSEVEYTKEIIEQIELIFDKTWKIKDNASPLLAEIRTEIKSIRTQINRNFDREVKKLLRENILGDTKEAYYNDRRVLTVLASHKRQVSGNVVGSSKTGSLVFIEPQVNIELNNELELQIDEERKEIYRILKVLTAEIAKHLPLIEQYQAVLTEIDFIYAKTRLGLELNCNLPGIVKHMEVELIDAFHPILWKNNRLLKKETIPQRIQLHKKARMLVISGPNAGGKSITLKTIGLLQIMLQSGLLIPVHPNSKISFFQQILSDIGDNQSIDNELSTYSYRLKRMKYFLKVTNRRTLLLLDEFGTGSDPDLGGALAEVFFEELYKKECFSVITTHYSNIKLKADQLPHALNGCMLFDTETLEPLFKFNLGQPGSSFTFEVAQINGIPQRIIEEAKSRLDDRKVKMDHLLSELQKEKNYFEKLNQEHREAQEAADEARNYFLEKRKHLERKIQTQQDLTEKNNKWLILGKKMEQFINAYNTNSKKKDANKVVLEDVRKYLALEKSKIDNLTRKDKLKAAVAKPTVAKKKKVVVEKDEYQQAKIVVGSSVKLISTKQAGTVEEINGNMITVLFGFMRMKVEREKLMWVQ
ncbi:MAG TPA: MutS2/Smr-associated SH3 domain-containing protein [Taishania sp.]|nr:MutS2/Smr-associated SH3 domain-containing protein [Taishania sp.]